MAISKTINTKFGITVQNAYHRVESVNILSKTNMTFVVFIYADKEKIHLDEQFYSCAYDINGSSPIKQAYEYFKTLPEFAGATDC